jgi:hypothetical protein
MIIKGGAQASLFLYEKIRVNDRYNLANAEQHFPLG